MSLGERSSLLEAFTSTSEKNFLSQVGEMKKLVEEEIGRRNSSDKQDHNCLTTWQRVTCIRVFQG
ncbi:unnamed protein product [Coffea canephora]|uniref:Uncharacterized protein n=1 Tax=Coffea canephora TaxID=49390 RepID=A0A068V8Q2_COFCA|nr:unnamed protein product [Coffea canephora]